MPRLLTIFGNQHCILYLRYMLATFTKESQIEQRSVWCLVNPELCNKEGAFSRSTTRSNWEAKNLFHSSQCTQEGKKGKYKFRRCQLHVDSQTNTGWDENICTVYDVIASEDHCYIATRWERSRNENSWKLVQNSGGANGPVDQRDDYKEAKKNLWQAAQRTCSRICQHKNSSSTSNSTRTGTTIRRTWRLFLSCCFRNRMEILFPCSHHEFFFIILVATIRHLVDSMELGLFIMEWAI